MGWCPGDITDNRGRIISVEQRSRHRIELSVMDTCTPVWCTIDEKNAVELLNHLIAVCNASFGKRLRIEED
jgi:hypothetical protein